MLCLNPVKLFLCFGDSAAPTPCSYVAALVVLCETRGSVRGLNRWEYEWLALSPNFNAQQHRWRENSYVFFKLTNNGRRSDIYSVRFWDVFRVKECIEFWSGRSSKTIAVNVSFLLKRQYPIYRKAFFLPLEHLYIYSFNRISTASFAGKKIWTKNFFYSNNHQKYKEKYVSGVAPWALGPRCTQRLQPPDSALPCYDDPPLRVWWRRLAYENMAPLLAFRMLK